MPISPSFLSYRRCGVRKGTSDCKIAGAAPDLPESRRENGGEARKTMDFGKGRPAFAEPAGAGIVDAMRRRDAAA
jgi:hypothetical protein